MLLCATGQARARAGRERRPISGSRDFRQALDAVMIDLAQQIVRDGEGAEKFVTIEVTRRGKRRGRRAGSA